MQPEPSEHARGSDGTELWLRVLVLCLAAAACYLNSLHVPFLLDDNLEDGGPDYRTRPLVSLSFDLNRALSARETWGFHAFNVLVHLACGLLLLGVLRRAMAQVVPDLRPRTRTDLAWVVTLVWLCHPLQTAAITYVSQRAESLAACFYLAVLYAFLRSLSAARPHVWQALALVALALGFATKETIATAPLVLLLFDAAFLAPGLLSALRRRRGFYAALGLATLALALLFIAPLLWAEEISAGFEFEGFGPLEYARTQPGVILHYLRLAVWPHPLCFDYGWPIAREPGDYLPQTALVAVLFLLSTALLVRRSWIGFAGVCLFLFLAPSSSFVPIKDPAFEHRMYLALAPIVLLATACVWGLVARFGRGARRWLPILAWTVVLGAAALTIRRNRDYRSAIELWRLTVEQVPHHARAHEHLGAELLEAGRTAEAIDALLAALRLDPEIGRAHLNLGVAYMVLEQVERAIPCFESAWRFMPEARVADALGNARFTKGDALGAAQAFRQAVELEPDEAGLHFRLAKALARCEGTDEAIHHQREAVRLDPGLQEAHIALSGLLAARGQAQEALAHSQQAYAILPNSAIELFRLGKALRAVGRLDEALDAFLESSRVAPEVAEPLAAFAETMGRKPDATDLELSEALRLADQANALTNSSNADYLEIGAEAHAALDHYAQAAALLEDALRLQGPGKDPLRAARLRQRRDEFLRKSELSGPSEDD